MSVTPEQAVDVVNERFGRHAGRRALHAKGIFCAGTFTATPEAGRLCRAEHLSGAPIAVRARVSNGGGDPDVADHEPDVRGLAVKFALPDGTSTDISSQSVPRFAFAGVEPFLDFVRASERSPAGLLRLPLVLARQPKLLRSLPANAKAFAPPPSFANVHFYGVHAFKWLDAGGGSRWVRYEWVPQAGSERLGVRAARRLGRDYLFDEFRTRVAAGPVRWTLSVQIAAEDDDPHDPSAHWPPSRERIAAGTLEITSVTDDPEATGPVVFDPTRVTDGIELSDDPVLHFRTRAYTVSVDRRA